MRHLLITLLLAALSAASAAAAPAKRLITETDLYAFQWIADPRISPDGTQIVYTHVTVTPKHDGYDTALWVIPTNGGPARQLTAGPRDTSPRWSPDAKSIAFVRAAETPGKPPSPQLYLLNMQGGEARQLTDLPKGASAPVWSPDGHTIAFTSTTKPADLEKRKIEPNAPQTDEPESDVRVITKAVYRNNGAGFAETNRPAHIWAITLPPVIAKPIKARQLTQGEFSETEPIWSRDASKIYFTSNRVAEPYYQPPDSDIYTVPATGATNPGIEPTKIASIDGPISGISLSPDGTRIAFTGAINRGPGVPQRSYSQSDLFVTSAQPNSTPKNLTAQYDFDIAGGIGGDQGAPRGSAPSRPYWSPDGTTIYVVSAEQGKANLKKINAETGKVEPLTEGNHDVSSYSATPDTTKVALLISTPTNIGDLFLADGKTGSLTPLTHVNGELFSQLNLTEPEMIWYTSFDGKKIQAWVQRPPNFDPAKKYPMILNIHGGPHSAYGYTFDHEFQWMAAKGYVVLYPNPRGSTTYGQDFGNIIQYHYPGDDHKDLMAGVDELIKRGWVDPEMLGITGGSGGGVLTNWAITQTNRFKAAVSQRSIADWSAFWYTADFSQFTPSWFRGAPWEQEADFKERSPITHITKVTTPLMLVEGDADLRTPPAAGGEQMFRALKYLKKTVVMVRFPGESHELSRSGKPTHRIERLRHIVGWMDKYVLSQKTNAYDLQ